MKYVYRIKAASSDTDSWPKIRDMIIREWLSAFVSVKID